MRPSTLALTGLSLLFALFVGVFAPALGAVPATTPSLATNRALVERYGLTDLALFTEARYTRHPSQADLHAAFQDHPAALEHFPSGALVPPRSLPLYRHAPLAGKTTTSH